MQHMQLLCFTQKRQDKEESTCSHHASAHTMPVLTPCQCSHHVSAHTMSVLTPCQCSHHASAHTMSVLTPCQCSHHVSAHTMPVLTPCQCSHHVSEVDGSSRASRRDVCPSLGSQKCTSLQVHIAEQHNPPQLWLAD